MSILAVPSPLLTRPAEAPGVRLRVTTAGSVDDGKSTLIGRLLYDSGALAADQRAALAEEGEIDLASLTDGLEDERAQGITIDVAYRYFATPRRSFVLADAPGHDQYTRNMVTAASQADLAIILVDASRLPEAGLLQQTRRHAAIAALMGLDIVFAVNKMDLIGYDAAQFQAIRERIVWWAKALGRFSPRAGRPDGGEDAQDLGLERVAIVPIAARSGCNVSRPSPALSWWRGPTLLELLEAAPARRQDPAGEARLEIQRVIRGDKRAYAGRIVGADLVAGALMRQPYSGVEAAIASLANADGPLERAGPGANVVVTLDREIDLVRGDCLIGGGGGFSVTPRFSAELIWLSDIPLGLERRYTLKQGPRQTAARITAVEARRDLDAFVETPALEPLRANDIGRVSLFTRDPMLVRPFRGDPETSAFVLIDDETGQTAAAGLFRAAV